MRTLTFTRFMRRSWPYLFMLLLSVFSKPTLAQITTVTIGTGTSTSYNIPYNSLYGYSYVQMTYDSASIAAGGGTSTSPITKIRFYMASGGYDANNSNWTVYMGNASKTSFTSTTDWVPSSSLTSVFSGTVSHPSSSGGWMEVVLSSSFTWDGHSSIIIAVDENASSYTCCNYFRYTSTSPNYTSIYYRSDGTNPNPASPPTASSRTTYRPNLQLVFESPCTGTPTAGAATASSTSICLGQTVTMSLTGSTLAAGITYQWQSSPDNATYSNISGATSSTYSTIPTAATYYRCIVGCSPAGTSATSTAVFVNFAASISSTTPGSRCGTGTVNLAATGSSGSTIKWYNSIIGGTAIGSGSPFTTPTITSTTNYYVGAESYSSGSAAVGTGTESSESSTGRTPFSNFYQSGHTQYLIRASDLLAAGFVAGNLTGLSFNVTSKSSYIAHDGYTIKMAHTTDAALTAMKSASFTTVYGPTDYTTVLGANNFSFGTSFNWDGSSNIIVDVCFDNYSTGSGYSSNDAVTFVAVSYQGTYGMYYDYTNLCGVTSGYSSSYVNAIPKITFTGNKACSSPRSMVTATVNTPPSFTISGTQTICNNTVNTLTVTSTLSNYNSYTWSPAANLFTNAACTVPYVAGSSASTVYYKSTTAQILDYICNAYNTSSLCANTDTVTITNLPSALTATATPASICNMGATKLQISPTSGYGTATLQWQSSPNNSTWTDSTGMLGTSLNTTTVSYSRYYRVSLKDGTGAFCLNSSSDTALVLKPIVDSVKNDSICKAGVMNLKAYGRDGILNWYSNPTGGTALDTGTNFTTPYLLGTTTYYVEATATKNESDTVGTGTSVISSTGISPFSNLYESARTQYLYTASDLTALGITSGSFTSMAFNVSGKYSSGSLNGYTIKFANTSATNLSSGFISPTLTTVYGPTDYTTASGWNSFDLSGGFVWDGTSNLLIEVCFSSADGSGGGWSSTDYVYATSKTYTASYGTYDDFSYFCSGGTGYNTNSTLLPNLILNKQGCASTRTAVVAKVNPLPTPSMVPSTGPVQICEGSTTTLKGKGGNVFQWIKTGSGPIAGATDSTYTTGIGGSYKVIVKNGTTGCFDSTAAITINVNPTPTIVLNPLGTTHICADSSLWFTTVATGSGLTYYWYRNDTLISGATNDSLNTNIGANYKAEVRLGNCADTSDVSTLIINPLPAASFTKTGLTGAICKDSTLELTALSVPVGSIYQWMRNGVDIPGATSQKYYAALGGVYAVRIEDSNNCRKVSDTMTIINTPMGIPNLTPKEATFCEGTLIKLYANAGPYASKYVWYHNGTLLPLDTLATYSTGLMGTYSVRVTDIYGCSLNSPVSTISIEPIPSKPVIVKTGTILRTSTPYTTYQWYRNGKILSGATSRNYNVLFDGKYHVVVTNAAGCFNVSDTLAVSLQGTSVQVIKTQEVAIDIYPNPSQDIIYIAAPIQVNLIVRDLQGKEITKKQNATSIDMKAFADGVYIFTITNSEGQILKMDRVMKSTR